MNTDTLSQLSDRDWAMYIRALIRPTPEDELKVKTYRKELLQGCLEDAESDVKQRDCQIKALQEENTEIRQRIRLFQEQLVVSRADPPDERLVEEYNRYKGLLWDKMESKIGVPAKFIEGRYWLVGCSQIDVYQGESRRDSVWTEEEDRALVKKSLKHHQEWALIARELLDEFPKSRVAWTGNCVRARMLTLFRKQSWGWSPQDKENLKRAYMEEAPEFWAHIGQSFDMNDGEAESMYSKHRELFLKG